MQNIINQQINLEGSFAETGFGFSCMKKAYELHIVGRLTYITSHKIEIFADGEESKLLEFYNWCLTSAQTSSGKITKTCKYYPSINEFKILNSI